LSGRTIGDRQRWAWLTAGLSAAAVTVAAGINWLWVLAGGLAAILYYMYLEGHLRPVGLAEVLRHRLGLWACILTFLWTVVVMGWAAVLADTAFPNVDGFPSLGWALLALTAWGSRKGAAACARCCGILCLLLGGLYAVILGFSLPQVELQRLRPVGTGEDGLWALGVFLLPAAVWYAPCQKGTLSRFMWLALPVAAAAVSAITAGVLSPELTAELPLPFYTLTQWVSIFGVVERIEPLLSAALTMGVFSLLSALACSCGALTKAAGLGDTGGPASCLLAAGAMFFVRGLTLPVLTVGAVVIWLVLPLGTVLWDSRKRAYK